MALDLKNLRNIKAGSLNPELVSKIGTPVATPESITDNPLSVYRKTMRNVMAPDILEGVNTFRGILLASYGPVDADSGWASDLFGFSTKKKIAYVRCMIPEIHTQFPNPFLYKSKEDFISTVQSYYPVYEVSSLSVSDPFSDELSKAKAGTIVEIRFDDPNRIFGYVTKVVALNEVDPYEQGGTTHSGARDSFNGGPTVTSVSGEGFPPSTRLAPATAQELMNAYPMLALNPDLALAIERTAKDILPPAGPMDPAHLANLINFESAGTFSAGIQSPTSTHATGLIQFTAGTARELGTSLEELSQMTEVEQMGYVGAYFELDRVNRGQQLSTQQDVAMAVYYPDAVGQGPDYSIYEDIKRNQGLASAEQYRANNNGIETASDYYGLASSRFNMEV